MTALILYRLTGRSKRPENADLPTREIDLTHIPLYELQKVFHVGAGNQLLSRHHVGREKAQRLEAFCGESIDTTEYRWEFEGYWSDQTA